MGACLPGMPWLCGGALQATPLGAAAEVGAHSVTGPSAFVGVGDEELPAAARSSQGSAVATGPAESEVEVWPEELVLALAAYCEQHNTAAGEIVLHVFPVRSLSVQQRTPTTTPHAHRRAMYRYGSSEVYAKVWEC
jgi:hypothetical protein